MNATSAPYRFHAFEVSYFSAGVRPALRYKQLWFEELRADYGEIQRRTGLAFIPVVVTPDDETWQDTSEILEHLETPGLGANIDNPELFKNQFIGRSPEGSPEGKLVVAKSGQAKNGWEIEALTGATVSPRGVVQAINDGLAIFSRYKDQILTPEGGAE